MRLGVSNRYALWFSAISFLVLSTVMLATGLLIWRSSHNLAEKLRQGTQRNHEALQHQTMQNLAEFLRRELFTPLYDLDIEYIERTLKDLRKGMPVTSARIADPTGKVLTDGTKENLSYGMQMKLDTRRLASTPVLIEPVKGGDRVTFIISVDEYVAGFGEIVFSEEPFQKAVRDQDRTITLILDEARESLVEIALTWTLFVALLAVAVSVVFSRTLSQPLIRLRNAAGRMAKGELDYKVEVLSNDEIGELASAFNDMGARLHQWAAEVEQANLALQAEVLERREKERALRESEERLVLAQKSGKVGVYDWNPVTRQGVWTGVEELIGPISAGGDPYSEWIRRVHPDDQPRVEAELQQRLAQHDSSWESEYRVVHRDGTVRWVKSAGELLYTSEGTPDRLIGTLVDVTDLKESQLRLLAAKEAAEAASRAKSDFLANMSHEMRTPLTGALGMINLVLEMELGSEEREMLEMSKRSAESLLRLISDLLEFSRLEAGILVFERKDFSLPLTVASAIEVVSIQAREKGLQLSWTLEESLPELVHGDEGRLRQVLINLLGNAVKFTERGEVALTVSRICHLEWPDREFMLFSLRDTGIGIPPEQTESIFGKFIQVDPSRRRKYGGTGLGLALSRQIVEIMGGRIWVDSRLGEGSTFHFTCPLDDAAKESDSENSGS